MPTDLFVVSLDDAASLLLFSFFFFFLFSFSLTHNPESPSTRPYLVTTSARRRRPGEKYIYSGCMSSDVLPFLPSISKYNGLSSTGYSLSMLRCGACIWCKSSPHEREEHLFHLLWTVSSPYLSQAVDPRHAAPQVVTTITIASIHKPASLRRTLMLFTFYIYIRVCTNGVRDTGYGVRGTGHDWHINTYVQSICISYITKYQTQRYLWPASSRAHAHAHAHTSTLLPSLITG